MPKKSIKKKSAFHSNPSGSPSNKTNNRSPKPAHRLSGRNIFRKTLFTLTPFIALILGVALGTYYHNEVLVWWRAALTALNNNQDVVTEETAPEISDQASAIILPRFDLTVPLVYSDTLEEEVIQEHLKSGAVVLPLGTTFGETGNVVITAHSSGTTAFGPYRFAFAKLGELNEQDQFQIKTPTATYAYRVYSKEVVWPHQVDHLPKGEKSTITLVTCWPPWTNLQRLLVHSELESIEYHI